MIRPEYELDIENLCDFFEVKLKDRATGRIYGFPMWPGSPPLDIAALSEILARVTIVTFNGNNYDVPILTLALYGADNATLKQAGDLIICHGMKPWDFYQHYGIQVPEWIDHVDVMEVAPGVKISLKIYAGRLHAPRMQDLPIDPNAPVPPAMRYPISCYCDNDLEVTGLLRDELRERLALRDAIGARYKVDVRSKSDAQIAETVIKAQLDFKPDRRYIQHGYSFKYQPPPYVRFATTSMCELLDVIRNADFLVTDKEEAQHYGIMEGVKTGVQIPAALKGRDIRIGNGVYRLGIGGLHSQESSVSHYTEAGVRSLWDIDVKSYYPSLILNMGMYPQQLGPAFLAIYRKVYEKRLFAKSEADRIDTLYQSMGAEELRVEAATFKVEADGLKIVLNGTFGKLFSKYSIFYAPEFGIATTMTGQLLLLMLIEMMEMSGIPVVSANTDGIVLNVPAGWEGIARSNIKWWERATGLEMEETHYRSIHSRDVNNYVAITDKGKVKRKGIFVPGGVLTTMGGKNPDKDICADAVVAFLKDGTPIEQTIRACNDIRKFVVVRAVSGGGEYAPLNGEPQYLGKAVRWYYGTAPGHIRYVSNGNKVAGSDGATPVMQLPASLPADINHQHYVEVAMGMLADIGVK